MLLTGALQLVDLLFMNSQRSTSPPSDVKEFCTNYLRSPTRNLLLKPKADASTSNAPTPEEGSAPPLPSGGLLRRSSPCIADSQDSTILRARVIRFKHLSGGSDDGTETDNDELDALKTAAKWLATPEIDLKSAKDALRTIADLFGRQTWSMSSFEMLKSGLIQELLAFASDETRYSECTVPS